MKGGIPHSLYDNIPDNISFRFSNCKNRYNDNPYKERFGTKIFEDILIFFITDHLYP